MEALVAAPEVRLVIFTGSSDVGAVIASNEGRQLKRCGAGTRIEYGDAFAIFYHQGPRPAAAPPCSPPKNPGC